MKIKVIDFGYENLPYRAHENDAGADVYICMHDRHIDEIGPHKTKKIPLGVGLILPDGYMACVYPRSGLASNGIVCEIPPIDSGYRNEVSCILHNNSDTDYWVNGGDRVCQLVFIPIATPQLVERHDFEKVPKRGKGGFGSTGK